MRLPTKNRVTCDARCHGYLATDYSWFPNPRIYAPERIRITSMGDMGDCGNGVNATGASGRQYRFCHLSKFSVKVGQIVAEGQHVGVMGSTGLATGPHLHLVMWVKDKRVDPDAYIKKLIQPAKKPVYYRVRPGDTVSGICKKFRISLATFKRLNPKIKNINLIYPLQKVRVK